MARIETELTIDSGEAVVSLGGALDVSNAHRLGALLRRLVHEDCRRIVVDLGSVTCVDAAGVGILRGAAAAVERSRNGTFVFRNAPADLAEFLTARGLREWADVDLADSASEQGRAGTPKASQLVLQQPLRPAERPDRSTRPRVPRA